jgi:hypothetical protein
MGLGDFILIIDKLGVFGIVITLVFLLVMFMGALVDIYQFWWVIKRIQNRKERTQYAKVRAQVLLEMHEKGLK